MDSANCQLWTNAFVREIKLTPFFIGLLAVDTSAPRGSPRTLASAFCDHSVAKWPACHQSALPIDMSKTQHQI